MPENLEGYGSLKIGSAKFLRRPHDNLALPNAATTCRDDGTNRLKKDISSPNYLTWSGARVRLLSRWNVRTCNRWRRIHRSFQKRQHVHALQLGRVIWGNILWKEQGNHKSTLQSSNRSGTELNLYPLRQYPSPCVVSLYFSISCCASNSGKFPRHSLPKS